MSGKRVLIVDWTHCIEDFLGNLGMTISDFAEKMTGGWLVGYAQALKSAGVECVFCCFSIQSRHEQVIGA